MVRGGVVEEAAIDAQICFLGVDHLSAADPRVIQLGMLLDREDADDAAARLAEEVDLPFVEALAEVVRERNRVGNLLVRRELLRVISRICLADAALIPRDDDEVPRECAECRPRECEVALTGAARDAQEHGLVRTPGADLDPLVGAVDLDLLQGGDASGDCRTTRVADRRDARGLDEEPDERENRAGGDGEGEAAEIKTESPRRRT